MLRARPLAYRLAAAATFLVQLALHTGIAVEDARAEGASVRQVVHVEDLGTTHAEHAHAPDCAISQHLQAHATIAAGLRAPVPPVVEALPLPAQRAVLPLRWHDTGTLSRAPPASA